MSREAKDRHNAYQRNYTEENPEKKRAANKRYWEKKKRKQRSNWFPPFPGLISDWLRLCRSVTAVRALRSALTVLSENVGIEQSESDKQRADPVLGSAFYLFFEFLVVFWAYFVFLFGFLFSACVLPSSPTSLFDLSQEALRQIFIPSCFFLFSSPAI